MSFRVIDRHIDEVLESETWFTLNKRIKADLIVLCQERALPTEGSKPQLIEALMDWKVNAIPTPVPSSPQLEQLNTRESMFLYSSDFKGGGIDFTDEVDTDKLKIGEIIGSGGFKDCYHGEYLGQAVAVGILRIKDISSKDYNEIKNEISVLKQLRHENIVKFIGVCSSTHLGSNQMAIITELCEKGDLFDCMRKRQKPPFGQLMMFMHDIALGVSYLHTRRPSIIHRDLKSMNVLVTIDNRAKINDFGLARIRPRMNSTVHTACGTPNWQAPEIWAPRPSYTEKVDVYACGLIFWEILKWGDQLYPYCDMKEPEIYTQVRDHGYRPSLAKLQKYPKALLDLIQQMWAQDPTERPPMTQVVEKLLDYLS